jgi:hypothetical protein
LKRPAKSDAKSFNDVFKESQASATREIRGVLSNFVRLKDKANRDLADDSSYIEKRNLILRITFGCSDIVDRLREAEAIGEEISWAEMRRQFEVWKSHDHIRRSGVMIEEGKTLESLMVGWVEIVCPRAGCASSAVPKRPDSVKKVGV